MGPGLQVGRQASTGAVPARAVVRAAGWALDGAALVRGDRGLRVGGGVRVQGRRGQSSSSPAGKDRRQQEGRLMVEGRAHAERAVALEGAGAGVEEAEVTGGGGRM